MRRHDRFSKHVHSSRYRRSLRPEQSSRLGRSFSYVPQSCSNSSCPRAKVGAILSSRGAYIAMGEVGQYRTEGHVTFARDFSKRKMSRRVGRRGLPLRNLWVSVIPLIFQVFAKLAISTPQASK